MRVFVCVKYYFTNILLFFFRNSLEKNMSAYKYKNDIKSRFHADLTSSSSSKGSVGDSGSNSSRDSIGKSADEFSRLSVGLSISPDGSSDSSPYPRSDNSSLVGSAGNMVHSVATSMSSGTGNDNCTSLKFVTSGSPPPLHVPTSAQSTSRETVPAFALHPSGAHYIPVVMHTHSLHKHFHANSSQNSSGSCHLISIPVSFGGPLINLEDPTDASPTVPSSSSQGHGKRSQPTYTACSGSNNRHVQRPSREFRPSSFSPFPSSLSSSSFITLPNGNAYPMDVAQPPVHPMSV